MRRVPPYAFCTAASKMRCEARQMSGPVPSPSMKGRIGVAGTCRRPSAMRIASPSRGGFSVPGVNGGLLRLAKMGPIRQNPPPPEAFHRAEPRRQRGQAATMVLRLGESTAARATFTLVPTSGSAVQPLFDRPCVLWATRSGPSSSTPGRNESSLRRPNGGLTDLALSRAERAAKRSARTRSAARSVRRRHFDCPPIGYLSYPLVVTDKLQQIPLRVGEVQRAYMQPNVFCRLNL